MTARPAWLSLRPETIPPELRALGCVLWRAEPRGDDKPAKVPYRVSDPRVRASSTDPSTWGTFEEAVDALSVLVELPASLDRGPVVGLGVVLTQAAGIACIDLDRVLDGDALDPHAAQIVARCDSWTERSPSGTGLHIFGRGTVAKDIKGTRIEVYSTARYIAVTGHHWPGTPPALRDQQTYLDQLAAIAHPAAPRRPWTGPAVPPPDDLAQLPHFRERSAAISTGYVSVE